MESNPCPLQTQHKFMAFYLNLLLTQTHVFILSHSVSLKHMYTHFTYFTLASEHLTQKAHIIKVTYCRLSGKLEFTDPHMVFL